MARRSPVFVPALASCLFVASTAAAGDHLLDDFESSQSPSPWVFYNGAEFPGATGSLAAAPGHAGKGAHLAYDLSAGGNYVAATLSLDTPVPATAISLWLKNDPEVRITLRVVDDTGQTLQTRATRPMYAWDAGEWYRVVIPVGSSSQHWGGADDGILHGSVHSLSILAGDPVEAGAVGAIDFDEVGWLDVLSPAIDPATLERVAVPQGSEYLSDRLGANIHFTSDDTALDALKSAGFRWVRMDLFWSAVEHQGAYDFGAYDGLVTALESRDMKAHFILCYGHPDHASGDGYPPQTAAEIQAFGDYAEAASAHFAGKNVQFEVWNEANIDGFWKPAADVNQYAALAKEAIHRVHAGNPAALVSTTGTAGVDIDFLRTCLQLGCANEADAVGVHPYRQGGPETAAEEILLLRELIKKTVPSNPPVWQTEWGYSSTWYGDGHSTEARARQAVLATRELLTSWALGFPLGVYYDVRDDGSDPAEKEHNFGLLANDHSDKPAMTAVRTLTKTVKDRKLKAFGVTEPSTLHVLELEGAQDTVYAVWSSAPGAVVNLQIPTDSTATTMWGQPLNPIADAGAPYVAIAEENGPVYVSVPKAVAPDAGEPEAGESDASADQSAPDASVNDGALGDSPGESGSGGGGAAPAAGSDDGGCGCRVAVGARGFGGWWLALLGGVVVARRRRVSRAGPLTRTRGSSGTCRAESRLV